MSYTERFTEGFVPEGTLVPFNKTANTYNTGWMLMSNYQRLVVVLHTGTMTASSTVDMALQQDILGDAASAKAITPAKAITQLTQAGGDGDDLVCIELQTEELDVDNDFKYVRAQVTVAAAACYLSVIAYRFIANYKPVPTTAWTEIVT